jgi:ABC-type branched-subunit amino acid transport system permease subunit
MFYRIAADLVLALHLGFIAFVVLGGLLILRYRWVAYVHVPAAVWGAFIEITGRICPLTVWENSFRQSAGESGYGDSFVEHYLLPVIYPAGLTRSIQFWIAGCVIVVNVVIYAWLLYRWKWGRTEEFSD